MNTIRTNILEDTKIEIIGQDKVIYDLYIVKIGDYLTITTESKGKKKTECISVISDGNTSRQPSFTAYGFQFELNIKDR